MISWAARSRWTGNRRRGATDEDPIVAIAAEVRGRGTGRIRMSRVEDVAARSLIPFVQTTVAPGATVRTDGQPTVVWRTKAVASRGRSAGLLSRRVHFPAGSWPAFLPTAPAGGSPTPSRRSSQTRKPNVGDTRAKWIPSLPEMLRNTPCLPWVGRSMTASPGWLAVRAVCCEPVSAEFPAETSIGSPMDVGAL